MSGVLFRNKKKTDGDNRPDYTGKIVVRGVGFWLSAWIKESRDTKQKFMSLAVEEHQDRVSGPRGTRQQQGQQRQQPRQETRHAPPPPLPSSKPPIDDTPAEEDIPF